MAVTQSGRQRQQVVDELHPVAGALDALCCCLRFHRRLAGYLVRRLDLRLESVGLFPALLTDLGQRLPRLSVNAAIACANGCSWASGARMPRRASRLSEAKTWLAPNRLSYVHHSMPTA
jgi:hypothetical protein